MRQHLRGGGGKVICMHWEGHLLVGLQGIGRFFTRGGGVHGIMRVLGGTPGCIAWEHMGVYVWG